jgi:pilus assembly protein CpaB
MGRRTLLLVAAFVVAALGTTLVFLYVHGANDRALADQKPVEVLVAKTDISAGTTGTKAEADVMWELKAISRDSMVDGALSSPAKILDKVATTTIFKGEQIIAQQFGDSTQTSPLIVPEGKMAISVAVGESNRLGTFLTAGSTVAVFVTAQDGGRPRTKVLLPSVQVIANGNQTLTSPATSDAQNGLLTLAVNQDQAQRLISSSKNGAELYFALRSSTAQVDPSDPGFAVDQAR